MTENNNFEKKLESVFSDQASKDSLLNINNMKNAQFRRITAKTNYFPYFMIFVLVAIIIFTAFESATMSVPVKNTDDISMNEISYGRDNFTNSFYSAFNSGKTSAIFIFLLLEGLMLYVGFLILELLLGLVFSMFGSKEAKNIKMLF